MLKVDIQNSKLFLNRLLIYNKSNHLINKYRSFNIPLKEIWLDSSFYLQDHYKIDKD